MKNVKILLIISVAIIAGYFLYPKISEPQKKLVPPKQQEAVPQQPQIQQQIKVPILMYHYVEYNQNKKDFLRDRQNVPPNIFENQLITLKDAGYTFITPKDLLSILDSPEDPTKKYIIISFDDGFRDFYTDAYPILKKHNVSAINYVPYSLLNGIDYMTDEMLLEVSQDPLIEIGSHTLNHAYLPGIPEEIAFNEISWSKIQLERDLGLDVTSFSYPYGNYDEQTLKLVKKAGYTNAVTVESGNIVERSNMFELKRVRPGHLGGEYLIDHLDSL